MVCGAELNISGAVWSPCIYNGSLRTEPRMDLGRVSCVAAGVVNNKTWAVLSLAYSHLTFSFPDNEKGTACCWKQALMVGAHGCAFPAIAMPARVLLIVNVDDGVGYYATDDQWCPWCEHANLTTPWLSYKDVVFGDAVYVNATVLLGAPDKTYGATYHKNCFLKMHV
jgi:hypothetical protein